LQVTESRVFYTLSTEKFAPFGAAKPGVPIFRDDRWKIIEIPTRWMFYIISRGRSARPNTWESYADAILDFLRVCEANDWAYMELMSGQLGLYRDQLRERTRTVNTAGGKIEKPLTIATINHRLTIVSKFYD
jgi:hypothetical protein